MRLLIQGDGPSPQQMAAALRSEGKQVRESQMTLWRDFLDTEDLDSPMIPCKQPTCYRCQQDPQKVGRHADTVPWSFNEYSETEQSEIIEEAGRPLGFRPMFAWGIKVKEVFAGSADFTAAALREGCRAAEPTEIFEDPIRQTGRKPEHDLLVKEVRERHIQ